MKKKFTLFACLIITIINLNVNAEEIVKLTEYNISDCIKLALKNNNKILIEQQKIIEAEQKIEEVKSAFYPNVSANFSYTRLEKAPSMTLSGNKVKIGSENNYNTKLQVLYPLYTAGATKIGMEISELGLKSTEINLNATNLETINYVYQTYYNVLKSNKYVSIAKDSINLLKEHEKNIQNLYSNEIATKSDLLTIQLKLAQAEQLLLKTQNVLSLAKVTFNQAIGLDVDSLVILKDYMDIESFDLKYDECLSIANKNRSEIKSMELLININEKKKDLSSTEDKLKLNLFGVYNIDEGGATSDKKWSLGISASLPIWDHERVKHKIQQDQSKKEQAVLQLLELKNGITLQVKQAYLNYESIKKELETYKLAIEQAKENYKIAEDKYKENLITNLEVLDAHTMLITMNVNYYSAIYDYKLALVGLKKSMGILE